jgi:Family of unknown function (DUF6580)
LLNACSCLVYLHPLINLRYAALSAHYQIFIIICFTSVNVCVSNGFRHSILGLIFAAESIEMRKIGEVSFVIVLLSLGRLAITVPNLEPIGAAALFGGALLGSWRMKLLIPFLALFVGDLVLAGILPGYTSHLFSTSFFLIYLAFGITVLIGTKLIGKEARMKKVVGAALLSSLVFFVLTNFGSWMTFGTYPKTFLGLIECYTAGLVFYKQDLFGSFFLNSVMGNVFFSTVAFGLYGLYVKKTSVVAA